MDIARRSFIGNAVALFGGAAVAGLPVGATEKRRRGRPRVRFGILTDTHIGTEWMMGINSAATEKALRDFRDRDVDGVAVLGDITNNGYIEQLEEFARIWNEVFPGDRGRDGRKVEKLFVSGNHELATWRKFEKQDPERNLAPRIAEIWERCFREPYLPAWRKEINGIQFTGQNWRFGPGVTPGGAYRREDLEPVLNEALRLASPGDPVFHLRHAPPGNTCWGSGKGGFGTADRLFGADERVFLFTGHLHTPVSHPQSIWQGGYSLVNAGVVTWTCFPGSGYPKELLSGAVYAKNQCIASVYDDEIVIERTSIWTGESLGGDWRIPLPLNRATFPYAGEKLKAIARTPLFPSSAVLAANIAMGENVLARMPLSMNAARGNGGVLLSFPAADVDSPDDMVMYYEATAVRADDSGQVATRKFFTEFYRGRRYLQGMCEHLFPAEDLPEGVPCRFEVRAVDFFGRRSAPLISRPVAFKCYLSS